MSRLVLMFNYSGLVRTGPASLGFADHTANPVPLESDAAFVVDSIATLVRLFPCLCSADLLRSWVRFEAVAPDDRFLIGPAGPEGLFVAAGDAGTGFVRAPAIGRLIREMLAEQEPSFPADIYEPGRFPVEAQ